MKWNTALFLVLIATTVVFATRAGSDKPSATRGREVYDQYCQRCHGSDGSGGKGPYNIRGREIWTSSPRELIRVLAFGASGRTVYGEPGVRLGMPPAPYSNEDLAAVAMYAMQNIGGRTVQISAEDVALVKSDQRKTLKVDTARGSTAR